MKKSITLLLLLNIAVFFSGCAKSILLQDKIDSHAPGGRLIYANADSIYSYDFQSNQTKMISNGQTSYLDLTILDNTIYYIGGQREPPFTEQDIYKVNLDGSGFERITYSEDVIHCISSPSNGRYFTYVGKSNFELILFDTQKMTGTVLIDRSWCPKWSPDGEKFVFFSNSDTLFFNKAFLYTVDNSKVEEISLSAHHNIAAWLPDSENVMLQIGNTQYSHMSLYNLQNDKFEVFILNDQNLSGNRCSWSTNPTILFCKTAPEIRVFDLKNLDHIQILETHEKDWYYPSVWSPDGRYIAYFETVDEITTSSEVDKHAIIDIVELKVYDIRTRDHLALETPITFVNNLFWLEP